MWKRSNFAGITNHIRVVWSITNNADHFRMIRITGDNDVSTFPGCSFSQMLDAGHKGTSSINHFSCTMLQLVLHLRSDTVCANDGNRISVGFVRRIYGRYSLSTQTFHLLGIVYEWTERANRASSFLNGLLDHFNGAFDAEAEPVFISKENFHQSSVSCSVDSDRRWWNIAGSIFPAFLSPLVAQSVAPGNPVIN